MTTTSPKTFEPAALHRALVFGRAPHPVRCGFDLTVGGGEVYPEINFTLPPMNIEPTTWPEVRNHYEEIGEMITRAAQRLHLSGLMVEFELLPPMTERPEWGAEVTQILYRHLNRSFEDHGLRSALRVTPVDIRDMERPPILRSGKIMETLFRSCELCARSGAHVLSIESVGGKEVHDEAMIHGELAGIVFALGVLAPRDMIFLWDRIVRICTEHDVVPGGDSACGYANSAMQLASQSLLPEVLAAVIRGASAVRSLVAVECGAVGPFKDCAYEGPILKAIAGIPIAMEGKSACCAHFSPVGNVAAAMCDLWSNESVQNIRLLSGYAPEAFLELLAYDCRLMNEALRAGNEWIYQKMMVESDIHLSPQALVLSPQSTLRIAAVIVAEGDPYHRVLAAANEVLNILEEAVKERMLLLNPGEREWLTRIRRALGKLPDKEETLLSAMVQSYGHLFNPSSYGLE